jgi:hypothetical protein
MLFFEEKQMLRSNSIALLGIPGMVVVPILGLINLNNGKGDWMSLIIISLIIVIFIILLMLSFLYVRIEKEGIIVRFFPFHLKPKVYLWSDIESLEVRKYKPLREFGGWGIKGTKSNKVFNISGDKGLQITFKSGKKLLIGTAEPQKLEIALLEIREKMNL